MKKSMVVIFVLIASSEAYAAQKSGESQYPLAADISKLMESGFNAICRSEKCANCMTVTCSGCVCCVCYGPQVCLERAAETVADPVRTLLDPLKELVGAARVFEIKNNYVNQQPSRQQTEVNQQQLLTDALSTTVQ